MTYSLLIWLGMMIIYTVGVTYFEAIKISNDVIIEKENKRVRSFITFLVNAFIASLLATYYEFDMKQQLLLTVLYQVFYWVLFDLFLNIHRGKSILYVSDNDRDDNDVWTDKIFHIFGKRYSGWVQMIFKVGLIITLIILI